MFNWKINKLCLTTGLSLLLLLSACKKSDRELIGPEDIINSSSSVSQSSSSPASSSSSTSSGSSSSTASTSSSSASSSSSSSSASSSTSSSSSSSSQSSSTSSSSGMSPAAPFDETVNSNFAAQSKLPYLFDNKSSYGDNEIYIAVVGINTSAQQVWVDCQDSVMYPMNDSYNTIAGPAHDPTGWFYADIWTTLSDIPSHTIGLPEISGCKMFIAFGEPLYIHFHSTGGYAQPNMENPTDPSRGIRFETIELSLAFNGLWVNTSRVDAYQYPMGVEVYGNDVGGPGGTYKKIGELKDHAEILSLWPVRTGTPFHACYVTAFYPSDGIIMQPSKIPEFDTGGVSEHFFQSYINDVWHEFSTRTLKADWGELGTWEGSNGPGNVFYMERIAGPGIIGESGIINGIPDTQEVIEAKGKLATGSENDKNVQKMFSASFNRHIISTNLPSATAQDWGNEAGYFLSDPHNEYVAFFHSPDISHNSDTYAFAYDDVFDHSSTIQATFPEKVRITIGGFCYVLP